MCHQISERLTFILIFISGLEKFAEKKL